MKETIERINNARIALRALERSVWMTARERGLWRLAVNELDEAQAELEQGTKTVEVPITVLG